MVQVSNAHIIKTSTQVTIPLPQSQVSNDVDSNILFIVIPSSKSTKTNVANESTIMTHMGPLHLPAGSHIASFKSFVELPRNNPDCARVDLKIDYGLIAVFVILKSRIGLTVLLQLGDGMNISTQALPIARGWWK